MKMVYYISGCAYVERHAPEEGELVGTYEVLERYAVSTAPLADAEEDFDSLLMYEDDIPKEPGVYAVMYTAALRPYQDYFGDYDVDVDIEFVKTVQLDKQEVKYVLSLDDDSDDAILSSFDILQR